LNLMKSILLLWFPAICGLYPHKLATAWMRVLLAFLMSCFCLSASHHHDWVSLLVLETRDADFCISVWSFEYTIVRLLGVDEVIWDEWQVVTAIHSGGDGLILCEWVSWDYDHTCSCHFHFGLLEWTQLLHYSYL
jgi:hypothetical protein